MRHLQLLARRKGLAGQTGVLGDQGAELHPKRLGLLVRICQPLGRFLVFIREQKGDALEFLSRPIDVLQQPPFLSGRSLFQALPLLSLLLVQRIEPTTLDLQRLRCRGTLGTHGINFGVPARQPFLQVGDLAHQIGNLVVLGLKCGVQRFRALVQPLLFLIEGDSLGREPLN